MEETKTNKFVDFFKWFKFNLMRTTNGMAIGLFGTLIIGTIIDLFGQIPGASVISSWATVIKSLMGAGIGLGVALSLKRNGVECVALMAAGFVGNYAFEWLAFKEITLASGVTVMGGEVGQQFTVASIGDPLSCYIAVLLAALAIKYIMRKKTPVDLILIPLVALTTAILYSFLLGEWVHYITIAIQFVIKVSFDAVPVLMCIIIAVLMGMALTAPISSVAICVAIKIGSVPLAAAAALIGCCTQMVGFAVHTAKDNKWGSVLAVGIGTSMLQFKNIIRKPIIWLPTIITSALLAPLAMLFPLTSDLSTSQISALSVGAGMGTSGLVGPLNFFSVHSYNWVMILEVIGFCVIAPAILVFVIDLLFRHFKLIEKGDFSLRNDI